MAVTYTQEEKDKVINFWNSRKDNPPDGSEIVFHFSDGQQNDLREAPFGRIVRQILLDAKIKAKTSKWEKVDEIILTDEQKEFIRNNHKENRIYDMAKILFPSDSKLEPLGREVRVIRKYLEEIGELNKKIDEPKFAESRYSPPDNFNTVVSKINLYLHTELSNQNMTAYEKKCVETTRQFLHSPRFVQEINNYATIEKRIAFESEFIRAVYNKPDLSPEEISLTINWCADIIQASDLNKLLEKLVESLENITADENGKFSQPLAETIGKVTVNRNEVLKRQERIYALLNKSRAKRDEEKESRQASLVQLFEWFRDEENRKKMLRQAELQREARKNEIKRIDSLDDTIMLSLGLLRIEGEI